MPNHMEFETERLDPDSYRQRVLCNWLPELNTVISSLENNRIRGKLYAFGPNPNTAGFLVLEHSQNVADTLGFST